MQDNSLASSSPTWLATIQFQQALYAYGTMPPSCETNSQTRCRSILELPRGSQAEDVVSFWHVRSDELLKAPPFTSPLLCNAVLRSHDTS
mmetsp:Transcript_24647/g.45165  ORF Transcript_24647/g.45165 Transcript_24647/m.45165 type:complete len:90 (-) Transcript_24647:591-860(-)